MEYPKRKQNRLMEFDYSTPGAYFITVCTKNRRNLFWNNVGAANGRPEDVVLSPCGTVVEQVIREIPGHYPAVSVDRYAIMPNHIHLLLQIHTDGSGRPLAAPTVSTVVQRMKGAASKQVGFPVWQKGFHDHVVRGEEDYREIWAYIEWNPVRWAEDKLCAELEIAPK